MKTIKLFLFITALSGWRDNIKHLFLTLCATYLAKICYKKIQNFFPVFSALNILWSYLFSHLTLCCQFLSKVYFYSMGQGHFLSCFFMTVMNKSYP